MSRVLEEMIKLSADERLPASARRALAEDAAMWPTLDAAGRESTALAALRRLGGLFEQEATAMEHGEPDADPFVVEDAVRDFHCACADAFGVTEASNAWSADIR